MSNSLEALSRELSKNTSSEYLKSNLESFGIFHPGYKPIQRKSSTFSQSSSTEKCTPYRSGRHPKHEAHDGSEHDQVRTTQLVRYVKNGKEYQALCEPRSLYNLGNSVSNLCFWPIDLDCVSFRPKFIFDEPKQREPFYHPEQEVSIPPILSAAQPYGKRKKIHVVYTNEARPGEWFTSSRRGPNLNLPGFAPRAPEDVSLSFESRFECGNLLKAVQVGKWDYELYMRCDLYTDKHTQWFFFGVRNMRPGQVYRFTIVNFYKPGSLYNHGMKPMFYSEKQASLKGIGWRRQGFNIKYFKTSIRRSGLKGEQYHYALTWSCQFPHQEDTCYFAHCYPYSYSDLKDYLHTLCSKPEVSKFCKHRTLCHTIAGNPVPVLTISNPSLTMEEAKSKKAIIITARVHPGESNSSWMMKGLIDFLTSSHQDARILREMFVFKIVPMLNPDGVIVGNYRCSLAGRDLNRNYLSDLKGAYPTIWHTKAMVQRLVKERKVVIYCDLHGHSRRQNVFIYGCKGQPEDSLKKVKGLTLLERVFPKMMSLNAPDKFSYKYCTFNVHKSKEGTGRVTMWRQMGILNSFTMEATFCGSSLEGRLQGHHFTVRDFEAMGYHLCDTLLDYCDPDQTNTNYILHQLQEERRELIVKQMSCMGLELPPDTDPLDLGSQVLADIDSRSSDDGGSDSSVSDGAPIGNFDLTPSSPQETVVKRKRKHKRKKKSKTKQLNTTTVPKLKMSHKENNKAVTLPSVDDSTPPVGHHSQPKITEGDKDESRAKTRVSSGPRPSKADRKDSAGSSVSTGMGGTVPTVQYRHRHSGIPIYVKERLEERQRKRSDVDSSHTSVIGNGPGSEATVHLDTAWSLQKLPMGSLTNYWRQMHTPSLNISSLVPQRPDGIEEGTRTSSSDMNLPRIGSHVDSELLPTDSAHLLASQMRMLMEKCNLPINPTNNLVNLSRFFRNARPPHGGRRVYMDMVKTLRQPNQSHASLHQQGVDRGRSVVAQPSQENVRSSGSFYKSEMYHIEDSIDKELAIPSDEHQQTIRSTSHHSIPTLPALSTSCSVTATEVPASDKRKTQQSGFPVSEDMPTADSIRVDDHAEENSLNGGYDSNEESEDDLSNESLEREGEGQEGEGQEEGEDDNPLVVNMTFVGNTPVSQPNSRPVHTQGTERGNSHPVPKSYSVPNTRNHQTLRDENFVQGWVDPGRRQDGHLTETAAARLSSAVIRGPSGVNVRQHKDRVAAAVEAIEEMKLSSNERVVSSKPRKTERGLPALVLFPGSNLKEGNLRVSDTSDVGSTDQQTLSDPTAPPNGKGGGPVPDRPLSRWKRPPSTTLVDGGTLPSKTSTEGHQQTWQMRYAGLLERLQACEEGMENNQKFQPTRPATRGYPQRPGSSKPEVNPGVVPKSVTLDFLPRISHTSHGKTRPAPPQ